MHDSRCKRRGTPAGLRWLHAIPKRTARSSIRLKPLASTVGLPVLHVLPDPKMCSFIRPAKTQQRRGSDRANAASRTKYRRSSSTPGRLLPPAALSKTRKRSPASNGWHNTPASAPITFTAYSRRQPGLHLKDTQSRIATISCERRSKRRTQ